jgi:hypothetical protein
MRQADCIRHSDSGCCLPHLQLSFGQYLQADLLLICGAKGLLNDSNRATIYRCMKLAGTALLAVSWLPALGLLHVQLVMAAAHAVAKPV